MPQSGSVLDIVSSSQLSLVPHILSFVRLHCDSSSLIAGGMLSVRSVCPAAAAATALYRNVAMLRAAASVAPATWADAATCVARVTSGGRRGGRWSEFPWKQHARDWEG